jgi:hypothetical protein
MISKVFNFIEKCEEAVPSFVLVKQALCHYLNQGLPTKEEVESMVDPRFNKPWNVGVYHAHFLVLVIAYMTSEDDDSKQHVKEQLSKLYGVDEGFDLMDQNIDEATMELIDMFGIPLPEAIMAMIVQQLRLRDLDAATERKYVRYLSGYFTFQAFWEENPDKADEFGEDESLVE